MLARKRKRLVSRQPNGQPSRSRPQMRDDVMAVVKAQRLRLVKEGHVMDQRAESPLGIYRLKGYIEDHHYDAGVEYARVVAATRRDLDSPSEDARNRVLANMQPGEARGMSPEALYTPDQLREKRVERRRRYQAAYGALRGASIWAFDAVYTVAIREKGIAPEKLPKLREGLDALAIHFRLTRRA